MTAGLPERFFALAQHGFSRLRGGEVLLASFAGEETDFVRFNGARVRQAMSIRQGYLTLSLVLGAKREQAIVSLSGDDVDDRGRVDATLEAMRAAVACAPDDPYLLYSTEPSISARVSPGTLPAPSDALDAILAATAGTDMVGLYASGVMARGFASSLGHRHHYEVGRAQLDFSLYHSTDKAVSDSFATAEWDARALASRIDGAREKLGHLARPPTTLSPGSYRAYLSPAAVSEIVGLLSWDGVSAKAQRTKTSSLQRLVDGEDVLSYRVTLRENTREGLVPGFDELGFVKPDAVDLIVSGRHAGAMVSPRTAREYGIDENGAGPGEGMTAADVAAGELAADAALEALDTGVAVGNLWYLNFSDRQQGRITGMTRFATFWVERGKIVAPLNVMRFDDTLYRMLGANLVALTRERDFLPSTSTYGQRAVDTQRLPGALLSAIEFTL